ncbi:hypothetical protein [Syntrophobotulus glycolicus]|uniref:hypothetical protein n=1 Tax=Syntrophobotulus glycolicus TaxID=51197 RepID=UPI000A07B5C3|nr:hypothetical protein [Syntrophobotulus glycolicus]
MAKIGRRSHNGINGEELSCLIDRAAGKKLKGSEVFERKISQNIWGKMPIFLDFMRVSGVIRAWKNKRK